MTGNANDFNTPFDTPLGVEVTNDMLESWLNRSDADGPPVPWRPEGAPLLESLIKHVTEQTGPAKKVRTEEELADAFSEHSSQMVESGKDHLVAAVLAIEEVERLKFGIPDAPPRTILPPWQRGYELNIHGHGGFVGKERRHYTIVGRSEYLNHVDGHRTLTAGSQEIRCAKNQTIAITPPKGDSHADGPWGRDKLTVKGKADYRLGSRILIMSGTVNRTWHGGVVRLSCMEGVICGGVFVRTIASPSATMSALMSGDVYGGCARVSVARTYLAVLQYRAAQAAVWAAGLYVRNATFVIEPLVSSPAAGTPKSALASKLARLARIANVVRMVCPLADILAGILTLPLAVVGIVSLIAGIVRKPTPIPPSGPPRLRTRNVGVSAETFSMVTFL